MRLVRTGKCCEGVESASPQVPKNRCCSTGCGKSPNVVILSEVKDLGV